MSHLIVVCVNSPLMTVALGQCVNYPHGLDSYIFEPPVLKILCSQCNRKDYVIERSYPTLLTFLILHNFRKSLAVDERKSILRRVTSDIRNDRPAMRRTFLHVATPSEIAYAAQVLTL